MKAYIDERGMETLLNACLRQDKKARSLIFLSLDLIGIDIDTAIYIAGIKNDNTIKALRELYEEVEL